MGSVQPGLEPPFHDMYASKRKAFIAASAGVFHGTFLHKQAFWITHDEDIYLREREGEGDGKDMSGQDGIIFGRLGLGHIWHHYIFM